MEELADKEVEHLYESLIKDLDDGKLYGKRIGDFEDKHKAYVVAIYYMGMMPHESKYDPTKYYAPIPVFER